MSLTKASKETSFHSLLHPLVYVPGGKTSTPTLTGLLPSLQLASSILRCIESDSGEDRTEVGHDRQEYPNES